MTWYSKANEGDWKYPSVTHWFAVPTSRAALWNAAQGRLPVDSTHQIHWRQHGNLDGEPVMLFHGGPGGAISADYARFFNPERYRVIMFDQRGCGDSEPKAGANPVEALKNNTTADLIKDTEKLRAHLGITGRMHLFGGSWGATLAMAYAMEHPRHVQSLVLRGIFLSRRQDLNYLYQGNAVAYASTPYDASQPGAYIFFPEAWKDFVEVIPANERCDMIAAYDKIFKASTQEDEKALRERGYVFHGGDLAALQDRAARAWSIWEGVISYLAQDLSDLGKFAGAEFARVFARIENHYFMHGSFLGGNENRDNNYLLDNVKKIARLPIYVVQGRYDQVCPRFQADQLVRTLCDSGATLAPAEGANVHYQLTAAGHSWRERETLLALTEIMDRMPRMQLRG